MTTLLLALGLVLVIEGLAFALAPSRIEEALRLLASLTTDQRRMIGLTLVTAGVGLITLVASLA